MNEERSDMKKFFSREFLTLVVLVMGFITWSYLAYTYLEWVFLIPALMSFFVFLHDARALGRKWAKSAWDSAEVIGTVESVVEDERGVHVTGVFEPARDPDLQLLLDGMAMERAKLPYITGATLDERKHELGHLYQPGEDSETGREGYCPAVHPTWADFRCSRQPGHSTNLKHRYAGIEWE